jgi:hypothetical protein
MNELKIEARGLFRWIKGARLVFLVLTLIGVSRVIGSSLGSQTLVKFGNFFAASPAPIPYQDPRSSDDSPNSGLFILCRGTNGAAKEFNWSTELQQKIPGPHRHSVFFLNLRKSILAGQETIFSHPVEKAFCSNGYLAVALGCPLPVAGIKLSYRGNNSIEWASECAK